MCTHRYAQMKASSNYGLLSGQIKQFFRSAVRNEGWVGCLEIFLVQHNRSVSPKLASQAAGWWLCKDLCKYINVLSRLNEEMVLGLWERVWRSPNWCWPPCLIRSRVTNASIHFPWSQLGTFSDNIISTGLFQRGYLADAFWTLDKSVTLQTRLPILLQSTHSLQPVQ